MFDGSLVWDGVYAAGEGCWLAGTAGMPGTPPGDAEPDAPSGVDPAFAAADRASDPDPRGPPGAAGM